MPFNLVCPSSRGLSLALSRVLLRTTPYPLIATARSDHSAVKERILSGLDGVPASRVTVLHVDVTDEDTISSAASFAHAQFPDDHLQYVFSTAGILHPERSTSDLSAEDVKATLETNVLGPLLVLKHFSSLLPTRSSPGGEGQHPISVWANVSARVGSIGDNKLGGWYSYRASKAALNSVTKSLDIEVERKSGDRAIAVAMHPGTVKTDLSREFWGSVPEGKLFSPEDAAEKVVGVVRGLGVEQRGGFWDWKGVEVEW